MNIEQVKALFLLANLPVLHIKEIPNAYWPKHPDYDEIRNENPWWLVTTEKGIIELGRRKRVIAVEWADTGLVFPFTLPEGQLPKIGDTSIIPGNNTRWETGGHAYGFVQMLEILSNLRYAFQRREQLEREFPITGTPIKYHISAEKGSWFNPAENTELESLKQEVMAVNDLHAMEVFLKANKGYRVRYSMEYENYEAAVKRFGMER